ncbi:MAG TPA: hypothetical protein VEV41_28305 [Terriglobales bacterium]|nr:hypothetical protein [Terriglobales bacterium]
MPVLILAVASFLFFFIILVLLWIADTLESRTIRRQRSLTLAEPLALLSISEAFDPIYTVLWEAPVAALELIDSAGTGIPVAKLRPIYERAAAHFPEVYDGCDFLRWLRFLEGTQLISWHAYKIVLTPEGRAFLRFRFVTDAMVEA